MAPYFSCKPLWSPLSLSCEAPSSEGIPWQGKDRDQKEKQRKRRKEPSTENATRGRGAERQPRLIGRENL
jgi:hypothetical protein